MSDPRARPIRKRRTLLLLVTAVGWLAFSPASLIADDATSAKTTPFVWGICGHPPCPDYADWKPGNMERQIGWVKELGCSYYRCSFEGANFPAILDIVIPPARAQQITVLPIISLKISAKVDATTTYQKNYLNAEDWANYAIAKGYNIPYWEIGNELENGANVSIRGGGTSSSDFSDKAPGGFVAIASALKGAYQGIHNAYAAARAKHLTTIEPKVLYGCTYRHWGLLAKIRDYNHAMPCDVISWHWYEPSYGSFLAPIHDLRSSSFERTPADCLADFKDANGQPMDVWITETNRSVKSTFGSYQNGSFSDGDTGQDWAAQAETITSNVEDLRKAPNVKAIFVYELLDENLVYKKTNPKYRIEGCYGMLTGINGQKKDAFAAYQAAIKANP